MQLTPISDRSPIPSLFCNSRGKSPPPPAVPGRFAARLLPFIAALHKTNIVQEDFQELERNTELFGRSPPTNTRDGGGRDLSSGGVGVVRLNVFVHMC